MQSNSSTEEELTARREAQAKYWEAKARESLDEADQYINQAYRFRQGELDDSLS